MVRNLKIRDLRLSKTFYLYIFAVVLADRNRVVNNIGNDQHPFADLALQLCFLGLEFLQLGSNAGHQPLGLLRFFLFPLGHQRADLLAGYVALVAQRIRLGRRRAQLSIQLEHLVHQHEFFILKFLFDVFLDQFRIGPDQTNVDHFSKSSFETKKGIFRPFPMGRKIPRCHPNCRTNLSGLLLVRYRVPPSGSSPAAWKVDRTASLPDLHQPPALLKTALTFVFLKCVAFQI